MPFRRPSKAGALGGSQPVQPHGTALLLREAFEEFVEAISTAIVLTDFFKINVRNNFVVTSWINFQKHP